MKIVLLSPSGAMHRYNGSFHKNLHYAPITLSLLAALVPKCLNAEVEIYDESAETIPLEMDADLIAITCITGTSERCYRYADHFRKKGIPVVIGGPHPSMMPEEAKEHADSVFIGMADQSWPEALMDFSKGSLKDFYYPGENPTIANRPLPRRDLLNKKRYSTLNTVEVIRGCNLNCSFCAYPKAFGRKVYTRPINDIVEEIKTLKGKLIIFPDVNLIADIDFARELAPAMKPLKKWWFGLATTAIVDDEALIKAFAESGCKGLLIGFESVNQASQYDMKKGVNKVEYYEKLMKMLHKYGIMVMGCFAFGADEDHPDVFKRTVEMANKLKIDLPRYSLLTPFPKTELYEQLEKENRIIERHWSMYDVEHCVFEPKHMSKEELETGITWAWKETYKWKSIFRRISWFNLKTSRIIALATNIGYRKYAQHFSVFSKDIMADNSDIGGE
jgi:radical SAM superfamily enzyme YgiQ (UPF0313 family)